MKKILINWKGLWQHYYFAYFSLDVWYCAGDSVY